MNGYVAVPSSLLDNAVNLGLKGEHISLVTVILRHAEGNRAQLPIDAFADGFGTAPRVRKLLGELEDKGYLKIERQPPAQNVYDVSPLMQILSSLPERI